MAYVIQNLAEIQAGLIMRAAHLLNNFNAIITEFTNLKSGALQTTINNSGSVLTVQNGASYFQAPYNFSLTNWSLYSPISGSVVLEVQRALAGTPTTFASLTGAGTKPTLSSATSNSVSTLPGWLTLINTGDIVRIDVQSASTVTQVLFSLGMLRIT